MVSDVLDAHGIAGVEDFGRFVSNTKYFPASNFDERAAAPVLLDLLPTLRDQRVVTAVGRHLQRPWLRSVDGAYDVVRAAYVDWAPMANETGWVLGDTLCKAADRSRGEDLVALAADDSHGMSRGCIIESLWRFKGNADVEPLLRQLLADPSVTRMAMSALQRTIGAQAMQNALEELLATAPDPVVAKAAAEQLRRVRRKIART